MSTPRHILINIALVGAGGFFGGFTRFLLDHLSYRDVPLSTLGINVVGAFLLPVVTAWVANSDRLRLFFTTGFISSFTTFSAISGTVMVLGSSGSAWLAVGYVSATFIIGLGAALTASAIARRRTT